MPARGKKSTERTEAVLSAVYEPEPIIRSGGDLLLKRPLAHLPR